MLKPILLFALLVIACKAFPQLSGRVLDSALHRGLAYATVSLVRASDSTLVTFTVADSSGRFVLKGVGSGAFLLSVSYAGYVPLWKTVTGRNAGDICLAALSHDITIVGTRPPVEIAGDTLSFNAENFKTQPNAVVEDLLRKMPGVTIASDGTVKVNGQVVRRILVNGKEFFTGDTKIATKNLPADAVDKVQVYDRKSDQASFTGVDDGNSEKTINLKLKPNRNKALFGKVSAAAGDRYDAQANVNHFDKDKQFSFIGMANNTNRQGFSLTDVLNFTGALRNGGGKISIQTGGPGQNSDGLPVTGLGQSQQGVATTQASGVNYNNTWGHAEVHGSYTFSHVHLLTDQDTYAQYILPTGSYNRVDTSATAHDITQHHVGLIVDQKVDSSFSYRFTPSVTWQQDRKSVSEAYNSAAPDDSLLNLGRNQTASSTGAFDASGDLLLRKRLAKKGRTLSADINAGYNHSTLSGSQVSTNVLYPGPVDSNIDQTASRSAFTRSLGGNLTYTEPLGSRSLLAFTGFYNVNTGQSDKQTYNLNTLSGKHDLLDTLLSSNFTSRYAYGGGGISYRTNRGHASLTAGANFQAATLNGRSFTDVLPNVLFQYQLSSLKNLRLGYTTYTTQPSVLQLQPVPDLSNPLLVAMGNPLLGRSYTHDVSLNYFSASPARRRNLMAFLDLSLQAHAIVQSDSVTSYGTQVSSPVNANGVGTLTGDVDYGFPIGRSQLEMGNFFTYQRNASFLNGARNDITSAAVGPNLSLEYTRLGIHLNASVTFNSARYSLQSSLNTTYMQQNYGVELNTNLPFKLFLHQEFNYMLNTGGTGNYNSSIPLWNASLSKYVFKNDRGEFKFSVMDLLNRNTGVTRSVEQGSILDQRYNVVQRYFTVGFTYSLQRSGLKAGGGAQVRVRTIGGRG